MVIQTTLSSRPVSGKGKGARGAAPEPPRPTSYNRPPSPSRTAELCPDDWMSAADHEAELAELDEIIRAMEKAENT